MRKICVLIGCSVLLGVFFWMYRFFKNTTAKTSVCFRIKKFLHGKSDEVLAAGFV